MTHSSSTLLRSALKINLGLSVACGLAATVFSAALAGLAGIDPSWLIFAVGTGLLFFAVAIARTLVRLRIGQSLIISGLDVLWVVGTLPLTLVPGLLTPNGIALILVLALAVGGLGLLQLAGIRAILRAGAEPGQYRHCISLRSSADPDKLWRVIRDLGGISRYSAGLSASRLEGNGTVEKGAVRVCTNMSDQSWAEEVVGLDDNARSVLFRFRSEAEDFPFPLAALSGGWIVTADKRGGALVDVWWNVTPKQRHFGWLIVALMTISLDRDLPRVVGAMEAEALGRPEPEMGRRLALAYC